MRMSEGKIHQRQFKSISSLSVLYPNFSLFCFFDVYDFGIKTNAKRQGGEHQAVTNTVQVGIDSSANIKTNTATHFIMNNKMQRKLPNVITFNVIILYCDQIY